MLLFGAFIYNAFTPLPLSEAETVNALFAYFPVVDVLAPFTVGAFWSILNVNDPLKFALQPARELIVPPPPPDIDTVYVPSDNPEADALFVPDAIFVPLEFFYGYGYFTRR